MMIGVRHALWRAGLSILVGIGIVAVLFGVRRSRRRPAVPAPVPAAAIETAKRGRGPILALVALLLGIGLIAGVSGGGDALRRLATRDRATESTGQEATAPPSTATAPGRTPGTEASPAARVGIEPGEAGGPTRTEAADPDSPTFDIVRIEPNGDTVVAGRAAPNGTVELLVDGKPTARAVADANGQFALSPPALPTGNSEIGLRVTDDRGRTRRSPDSVAVVVAPARDASPLVALTAPDKPTVVLSHPAPGPGSTQAAHRDAAGSKPPDGRVASGGPEAGTAEGAYRAAPGTGGAGSGGPGRSSPGGDAAEPAETTARHATGPADAGGTAPGLPPPGATARPGAPPPPAGNAAAVKIVSIDAQDRGRLYVTGRSSVGSTVRLYLNDTLVAPAQAGRDGSVTFTIGRGVKPGAYTVRLDQVDAATGKVLGRVEVPFSMPEPERTAAEHPAGGSADAVASAATQGAPQPPTAAADPSKSAADAADVFVPEVSTARIVRGDSLWQISRRIYGAGDRYTVIYDANQDQIRNPDLIYPGQIFVLPSEDATEAGRDEKRG